MKALLFALCLTGPLLLGGASFACEGSTVVLEDNFQDDSGGWDPTDAIKFGPSGLVLDVGAEFTNFKELNSAFTVGDADICADIAFPTAESKNPSGGIVFWAVDYSNFYLFQVSQAGGASLWRLSNNKWNKLYSGDAAQAKKDLGATNTLRVTIKGGSLTAYVNGEKVRSQKAQAPKGDSQFGFYVQLDQAVADVAGRTFSATHYKVTDAP